MSEKVSYREAVDLLRRVGNSEITPRLKDPVATWDYVFCGEVDYIVGDWEISIFNDCNDFDYIDSVKSPDGRIGGFKDWFGPEPEREWLQPDDILYHEDKECYYRMVKAFEESS